MTESLEDSVEWIRSISTQRQDRQMEESDSSAICQIGAPLFLKSRVVAGKRGYELGYKDSVVIIIQKLFYLRKSTNKHGFTYNVKNVSLGCFFCADFSTAFYC